MSNVQIPNLGPAVSLNGTEQFEGVQAGTSVRITAQQIATYTATAYPAPGITSVSASAPISANTVSGAVSLSLDLQGVTNAYLATMAAGTVKANVTGGSASPSDVTVSALLDTFGTTKGSLLVRDTSAWTALTSGTSGQVLTANGTTAVPSWQTLSISPGTLTPTGVVAGTYGSASTVPRYTVLASGQLSAATNVPIVIPNTSVTGLGTMAVQDANGVAIVGGAIDGTDIGLSTPANAAFTGLSVSSTATFATIASGTWQGTPIAVTYGGTGASTASGARTNLGAAASGANSDITSLSGLTTPLSAPQGGTGFGSYTTGDLLYADTSSTLARLNDVATGNALISGGVGVAPAWGKVGLTTHVSGILPVTNGGSGASSLTGFLKGNGTSPFTTQATIDNADLTNSSLTIGSTSISLGSTATTIAGLTTLTLTQDPTLALEAATKQYVDNEVLSVSNLTYHASAEYGTTADLGSVTYSNGTGGVGATLTQSGAPSVLIIDGYTFTASDVINATRVLVKDQTSGLQNGVYVVTNEGSGAANWQLTRATDFDATGTGPNNIQTGAAVFVTAGAVNASTGWVMNTTGTITVGSTSLNWTQISSSASVTVTSPLQKVGSVISLTTVPVNLGGTNLTSYTQYGLLYAPTTGSLGQVGVGSSGQPLLSGGAGSAPAFGALSLSGSGVSGTLGVSNGGTGTSTAFTTGSVVFAGASGVYSQDADLFWDNTNKFLGIGSNTPRTSLTIVSATQTTTPSLAGLPAGTDLYIVGADAANTRITQDAYGTGNYPAYTGRQARGTAASPTASQTGDILVEFTGRGYGDTAFSASSIGRIDIEAAETFTDTAQGTYISLHTSALGAASAVERFRIGPSGQFGIGGASYGTSGYVLTSGGASAAPTWSQISVSSVTGTLPVGNGGTGLTSYTIGDLIYASGATTLSKLADVATGNALISGGVGVAPSWGKIGLTTHVSGTLPIGNGGTGVTSTPTNGQLLIGNGTGYLLGTLTAGSSNISITNGAGSITLDVSGTPSLTSVTTPLVIGGTTASSTLTLESTSGAGTTDAIYFKTGSQTTRMTIASGGNVSVDTGNFTVTAGNLTFGGTGQRITGDMSNATNADRLAFQSSTTNGSTQLSAFPNGTGSQSGVFLYNSSDTVNNAFAAIRATGSDARFQSGISGTGSYLPMTFYTNGTEKFRIAADATGTFTFGGTAPRITGDFSNATVANRVNFQTSTTNGATYVSTLPLGTGTASGFFSYNAADGDNASFIGTYLTSTLSVINSGKNGTGSYLPMTFYTGGSERMRVDTSGNVGIGTSAPAFKFVSVGGGIQLSGGTTSQEGVRIQRASGVCSFTGINNDNNAYNALSFATSASEAMRIDTSGNVGIGTASPGQKLDVNGSLNVGPTIFTGTGVSTGDVAIELGGNRTGSGNSYLDFHSVASTDYDFRILRNSGANGGAQLLNTGVGDFQLAQTGAGPITFLTSNSERMRIASDGTISMRATGSSNTTHVFAYNENGGEIVLYDNTGATGSLLDLSSGSSRFVHVLSTGNQLLGIGAGNTTGIIQFCKAGFVEAMRLDASGRLGINTTSPASMLHVVGTSAIPALETNNILETSTISATAATGTINYDVATQSVLYYTSNATANWTLNIRASSGTSLNTFMATGDTLTIVHMVTQGGTAYYNSAVQVDGSSVTPKWQGGTAPTAGNASSIDIYTYTVIKTGSAAFTVLASQTQFK